MSTDDDPLFDGLYLPDIISRGRTDQVEFLEELPAEEVEFAKLISGFGNASGGIVLLGVKKSGEVIGLDDPDEVRSDASDILKRHTQPRMDPDIKHHEYYDMDILSIKVDQYSTILYALKVEAEIGEETEDIFTFYRRVDQDQDPMSNMKILEKMQLEDEEN